MTLRVERELFQWDKNRYVYLDQGELEQSIFCIQFFNGKSRYSLEIPVLEDKAKIPNSLLKENLPITALACVVKDGESQVLTRRTFKVLSRPRPEYYIDDDTSIQVIYDGGEEV